MRKFAIVIPLVAIMVYVIWYVGRFWMSLEGPDMPADMYAIMALGIFFSLVVGCGLMALVFYSSRHGYDEPSQDEQRKE